MYPLINTAVCYGLTFFVGFVLALFIKPFGRQIAKFLAMLLTGIAIGFLEVAMMLDGDYRTAWHCSLELACLEEGAAGKAPNIARYFMRNAFQMTADPSKVPADKWGKQTAASRVRYYMSDRRSSNA